jgi:hypothetical protein
MSLLAKFVEFKNNKLIMANSYEEHGSLEMAYVALWSVTEHTVKSVEEHRKTQELKAKVKEWHQYFENGGDKKRPPPIKSFVCEVNSIPQTKLIEKSLGSIPAITKLFQTSQKGTSGKYRDKRNSIAHHAEKFKNEDVYQDYKNTAFAAMVELEVKLKELDKGIES